MDKIRSKFKGWFVQSLIDNVLSKRFWWNILVAIPVAFGGMYIGFACHISFWDQIILPIFRGINITTSDINTVFAMLTFWGIIGLFDYDFLFSRNSNDITYCTLIRNEGTISTQIARFIWRGSIVMVPFFCWVFLLGIFEIDATWVFARGILQNTILCDNILIIITTLIGISFKSMLKYTLKKVSSI